MQSFTLERRERHTRKPSLFFRWLASRYFREQQTKILEGYASIHTTVYADSFVRQTPINAAKPTF